MLLYSSSDLYAVFQPGKSDFLLITFGFNGMEADDSNFWGKHFCQQAQINAVGFMCRRSDWFPASAMLPAIAQVLPQISQFRHRITYGGSMGGFGALRYAKELGADTTIAYSPQYSIDPKIVGHFDPNFTELFQPLLNNAMEPDQRHIAEHAYVFFDPLHVKDREHARLIKAAAPGVILIDMPHTGHSAGSAFASTYKATRLIEAALNHDTNLIRRLTAEARRTTPVRTGYVAAAALNKHPRWAAGIVSGRGSVIPPHLVKSLRSAMKQKLSALEQQARSNASIDTAIVDLRKALKAEFSDGDAVLGQARKLAREQRKEEAVDILRSLVQAAPRHAEAHFHLAGMLIDLGQLEEAVRMARRATELEADNAHYHARHAVAEDRIGNLTDAVEASRRAVSCAPIDVKLRDVLSALLIKQGRFTEALDVTRKAVALDPAFLPGQMRLSHLAAQAKSYDEALQAAQQVVALDGEKAQALLVLALRHRAMNNLAEATKIMARGLQIDPHHKGLLEQFKKLQDAQ
ncbi:tetratricopeptide repeat protein [Roseomonas elaeocarpi]|uniref:Tetratricopeptide repeat protein n=1 Tax=Roseomonas elaeocarpi TaxID=907779 RepID=A0ABV6JNS4_9PROT